MKVIVKWENSPSQINKIREFDIEYSIGDIIQVTNYGDRYADQAIVFSRSIFPIKDKPFNPNNEVLKTYYLRCNERYHDLEWKIIDIGYVVPEYNPNKLSKNSLVIRIIDRRFREMLFVYDPRDVNHGMKVLRKSKKEVGEYVININ